MVSYKGSVVVTGRNQTEIAKSGEVLKFEKNRFRFLRHHLEADEKAYRDDWEAYLADFRDLKKVQKAPTGHP